MIDCTHAREHPAAKVAIVISNFNYAPFVVDAIRSCQQQTHPALSVIIIDDGSTDNSASLITDAIQGDPRCTLVRQENGGQLSAFNAAAMALPADAGIVLFLDSDDLLEIDCVAVLLQAYQARPDIDCIFSTPRPFSETAPQKAGCRDRAANDLGFSTAAAWFCREWIGVPTSGLSMRASLVRRLLPIPLEEDWRIRADDCLVWGSSLAGARKLHLGGTLVHYRTHGSNSFHGKRWSAPETRYRHSLAVNRLWQHFDSRFALSRLSADDVYLEFRTQPKRTMQQAFRYTAICRAARFGTLERIRLTSIIWARWAYDALMKLSGAAT